MSYSTKEEVREMLKDDALNAIIGDTFIEDPAEREELVEPLIEAAIADADAEIDGYLAKRYTVPISPAPRVLNKFSKDIAVYNLFSRNLTGGRLSAIRDKFVGFVTNIASGVSERFTAVKTAFSNGITAIKNTVTGAVTWFFESGKRVVTTFANGIKSAFTGAVDAVKGGLQRIRNMLPFSDAKEGPLSTLTLSGQRTMTTYAHGLELAQDAPAQAIEKGLDGAKATLEREPVQKVDLTSGGGKKEGSESGGSGEGSSGKQVIIQKLLIPVDLKKIKDLEQLLAMLKEVEDYNCAGLHLLSCELEVLGLWFQGK